MNEAEQIHELLWNPGNADFWESDQHRNWSMQMVGGMSVSIDRSGPLWAWTITRADRSNLPSARRFSSIREAKNDLRAQLERMRREIVDNSMGPASIS